jgi:hypothetical protein
MMSPIRRGLVVKGAPAADEEGDAAFAETA